MKATNEGYLLHGEFCKETGLTVIDKTGSSVKWSDSYVEWLEQKAYGKSKENTLSIEEWMKNHPFRGMITCKKCGNKRCPKANNESFKCTNSNDVGQIGILDES